MRAVTVAGVVVMTACGLLAALLECLLVPLYSGSVIVPVSVVLAVAGNVALPWLTRMIVPNTGVAALPFLAWLVVVIGFGTTTRPEGDVILPGAPTGAEYVTYGMLLFGALAGAGTLVALSGTAQPKGRSDQYSRSGTNPGGGSSRYR